jgi:hypothetical protein
MITHNNKWQQGLAHFEIPTIQLSFLVSDGIYITPLVRDETIGEEMILIIFDQTDFIYELSNVIPFRFYIAGLGLNTSYGPLLSLFFYIKDPHNERVSFAIYDKPIDISNQIHIQPWVTIAKQSHIHLILIDKNYKIVNLFEFKNDFNIHKTLSCIPDLGPESVIDFNQAMQEYFNEYNLPDLFNLAMKNK